MNVMTFVTCPFCAAAVEVAVPARAHRVQAETSKQDFTDGYYMHCPDCGERVYIHFWIRY